MKDLTDAENHFKTATLCHICNMKMGADRVIVHDHLTGNYRGSAKSNCNFNYNNSSFIPVFIHTLAGYDTHLFIKEFSYAQGKISVILNNKEKYIPFSVSSNDGMTLRFLDTLKCLVKSLDELARITPNNKLRETSKYFNWK